MKIKTVIFFCLLIVISIGCSKKVKYSSEFKEQTSGRYLYNSDMVIDVYYEDNKLFLRWLGEEVIKPIVLDENTFFVADLYKKFHFVQHPNTKKRYLSVVSEDDANTITYDYVKVADSFKTPSMYLKNKEYNFALKGYLDIKKEDSTSVFIRERDFNQKGYEYLRKKQYHDAIEIFKINAALHPNSDNVFDSLADGYLRSGDSLNAFIHYNKALELNSGNKRAKDFISKYSKKQSI